MPMDPYEFDMYAHTTMFNKLLNHIGHKVTVVSYSDNFGELGDLYNVSVECEDCGTVLDSYDLPDPETLADEDLFSCEKCKEIFDIEDSICKDKMLCCEVCDKDTESP